MDHEEQVLKAVAGSLNSVGLSSLHYYLPPTYTKRFGSKYPPDGAEPLNDEEQLDILRQTRVEYEDAFRRARVSARVAGVKLSDPLVPDPAEVEERLRRGRIGPPNIIPRDGECTSNRFRRTQRWIVGYGNEGKIVELRSILVSMDRSELIFNKCRRSPL
jgi:hypothetical protein